jgi:hypothetical protein
MKKILILSTLFAWLFGANVHGALAAIDFEAPTLVERVKFGVGFGLGVHGDESSLLIADITDEKYRFLDFFGEYMIDSEFGIRLSVQPAFYSQSSTEECLNLQIWKIAPTVRMYVGSGKRLCLFLGPQIAILARATEEYLSCGKVKQINLLDRDRDGKLAKTKTFLKLGWDYECENGVIVGGMFATEWKLNDDSKKIAKKTAKGYVDIFPSASQQLFYVGYNFARLLE